MSEFLSNKRQIVDIVRGNVFVVDSFRDMDFSFWLRVFLNCFCREAGRKLAIHRLRGTFFGKHYSINLWSFFTENKVYIEAHDMGI